MFDLQLLDYVRDLPVLIPYALRQMAGYGGLMAVFRLRVFVCVLLIIIYLLTPFDVRFIDLKDGVCATVPQRHDFSQLLLDLHLNKSRCVTVFSFKCS